MDARRLALKRIAATVGGAMACANMNNAQAALNVDVAAPVPPELMPQLPQARLHGASRFRYFGFHVYDAQLWTLPGFQPAAPFNQPFGLCLIYARSLKARNIAERSLQEMRRHATIGEADAQRWTQAMSAAFADVRSGDRLTGLYQAGSGASFFFFNGQATQTIADARFARLFFGIWLSETTSEPALRRALLGV